MFKVSNNDTRETSQGFTESSKISQYFQGIQKETSDATLISLLTTFNIFHILSASSVAFVQVHVFSASKDKKFVKKWATVEWVNFFFSFFCGEERWNDSQNRSGQVNLGMRDPSYMVTLSLFIIKRKIIFGRKIFSN